MRLIGVRIVPIQFVVNDILAGMRRFGPLQRGACLVDVRSPKVARLGGNTCDVKCQLILVLGKNIAFKIFFLAYMCKDHTELTLLCFHLHRIGQWSGAHRCERLHAHRINGMRR